ncbi:MAG: L-threonylcarbamoyladenylate synthase, partial [Pseudomonadota bacterium]
MTKVTTQNTTSGPIILTASSNGIARAAKALRDGKVVGFGTETVYGLGALASDQSAVASVFQLKRRPSQNPLICHVDGRDMAETIARVDRRASMVMAEFWPGPLTLILPQKPAAPLAEASTAGLATVAVRAPAHDTARRLITAVDAPIVAPSANKSGGLSPTSAAMVADAFRGEIELILSGGNCTIGLESTVLDLSQETPAILRMGAITPEHLDHLIPGIEVLTEIDDQAPRAPGQMLRHYAPAVPVRINVRDGLTDDEAFLSFGP